MNAQKIRQRPFWATLNILQIHLNLILTPQVFVGGFIFLAKVAHSIRLMVLLSVIGGLSVQSVEGTFFKLRLK